MIMKEYISPVRGNVDPQERGIDVDQPMSKISVDTMTEDIDPLDRGIEDELKIQVDVYPWEGSMPNDKYKLMSISRAMSLGRNLLMSTPRREVWMTIGRFMLIG